MSKYDPLRYHFRKIAGDTWTTTFAELERILGFKLPPSAYNHRAWWGNNDVIAGARAWMDSGWRVASVNQLSGRVTFQRATAGLRRAIEPEGIPRALLKPKPDVARARPPVPDLSPYPWDEASLIDCRVQFQWHPIGRVTFGLNNALVFPMAPAEPGLYRFQIRGASGHATYIGETENLQRRFQGYRTPGVGQLTNIRIRDRLAMALGVDDEVGVAIVSSNVGVRLLGEPLRVDLGSKAVRLLLENAALIAGSSELVESLNR